MGIPALDDREVQGLSIRIAIQPQLARLLLLVARVAWIDEDNAESLAASEAPAVRVDVLSTVTEPEASAIRTAVAPRTLGVGLKVFRPDHLAAIKFLAGRPQDLVDFDELIRRGVDLERVRSLVAAADETQVAAVTTRGRRALKPPGLCETGAAYLSRDALDRAWKASASRRTRVG